MSKGRLTLLVTVSMCGEKCSLLAIGKSKNPRYYRGVQKLLVKYQSNKNAWMTSSIFEQWLRKWNRELMIQNRRITLVLDNCTAHPKIVLQNIELVLLPPNVTCVIQPCDQGITRALKHHYRRMVLMKLLVTIKSSNNEVSAVTLARKLDMLSAISLIEESWSFIVNCFRKAKFYEDNLITVPEQNISPLSNELDFIF